MGSKMMSIEDVVNMVCAEHGSMASIVQAHKNATTDEQRVLLELAALVQIYVSNGRPPQMNEMIRQTWNKLCDLCPPQSPVVQHVT